MSHSDMNAPKVSPPFDATDWEALLHWGQFQASFLARTSHEIRSPLSSLMSLHQLILNDLCDDREEERDCIRQAYEAAARLLKMLEGAVQISKLEAGLSPLKWQSVNLQDLLNSVRVSLKLQVANRNCRLEISDLPLEDQDNLTLWSDPRLLCQALMGMVESRLYSSGNPKIQLSCHWDPDSDQVIFQLQDDRSRSEWETLQHWLENAATLQTQFNEQIQNNLQAQGIPDLQSIPDIQAYFSGQHNFLTSYALTQKLQGHLSFHLSDSPEHPNGLQLQFPQSGPHLPENP